MKDYYDQKSKTPDFQLGQCVWVYTPKTKNGLSKKLLHNWFGPYRIVEQSSPVHYRLRTDTNKNVTFAVHANRMKPFIDPNLRPIDPPLFDDSNELYLDESDILSDSCQSDQHGNSTECAQKLTAVPAAEQPQSTQPEQFTIDNQTVFSAERILKRRKRKGKNYYLVKWLGYPESQSTWEPEENILDERLIKNFEKSLSFCLIF